MRRVIAAMPNGRHEAEVLIEDDVTTDDPIRLKVAVTVAGDNLTVDWTGTSAQRDNALNVPDGLHALDGELRRQMHRGAGDRAERRLQSPGETDRARRHRARIRSGPAAVSVRHLTQQALADCVLKAMAPLAPNHASAGCHVSFPTFCAGGFDDRAQVRRADGSEPYYVISDIIGGGMGGHASGDGLDAVDTHGGNCALLSAEVMETLSPFRVLKTELVEGSGGAGQYRGGLGIVRDYEHLAERSVVGAYVQQTRDDTRPGASPAGSPAARPACGSTPIVPMASSSTARSSAKCSGRATSSASSAPAEEGGATR